MNYLAALLTLTLLVSCGGGSSSSDSTTATSSASTGDASSTRYADEASKIKIDYIADIEFDGATIELNTEDLNTGEVYTFDLKPSLSQFSQIARDTIRSNQGSVVIPETVSSSNSNVTIKGNVQWEKTAEGFKLTSDNFTISRNGEKAVFSVEHVVK